MMMVMSGAETRRLDTAARHLDNVGRSKRLALSIQGLSAEKWGFSRSCYTRFESRPGNSRGFHVDIDAFVARILQSVRQTAQKVEPHVRWNLPEPTA